MRRRSRRCRGAATLLAALSVFGAVGIAQAGSPDGEQAAREAVDQTVQAVLAVLRDKQLSPQARREEVEKLAYDRFDFQTISKLVLARNWPKLSAEQRAEFTTEFKRHLSLTYGKALEDYRDEKVEISATRRESNGDVTVRTQILGHGADPVKIDYRLRQHGDKWYVIDVIIEGVSMLSNFRSQAQELISQHGPDGLIRELRAKNEQRAAES